ncbi:MAG TPA: citrate synthase [Labilithrix sp.]|nr:citrate synthase [Labilithrix sp.]
MPGLTSAERNWVTARDAARLLGIKKETLYAYASRGLVRSVAGPGPDRARLYHRDDLERLKARSQARSGHGPVAAGALRWGEPVLETRIGTIGPEGPVYRGTPALELVRQRTSFEDVCALLWGGAFVEPQTTGLGVSAGGLRALLQPDAQPFDAMSLTAAALAAAEPRGEGIEVARLRASALVRRLVASCALPRGADALDAALAAGGDRTEAAGRGSARSRARDSRAAHVAERSDGTARSLLVALGARTTASTVEAMTEALVLSADHELNASTFAARVAASTGANLAACIVAALAALSGPQHGATTARVEALVAEIERPERAAEIVAARLDRGESVPGFGHPLYAGGDPRGARLLELAQRVSSKSRVVRVLVSVANAMHLVARERPTLDVGLTALAGALALPRGAPMAVFACGRLAGWIAHVLEQREAGHLLRPRARYVGA